MFTRTVGAALATAGLLFSSAASVAASGATEGAGHGQANVATDQSGCGLIPLDVELIIDRSGSMGDNKSDGHTRLYWAKHAADQLVDNLDGNGGVGAGDRHHVGVTSFNETTGHVDVSLDGSSASAVKSAINALDSTGDTPLAQGMAAGAADMSANGRTSEFGLSVQHVIIILSDGRPWPDKAPARPSAGQIGSFRASADSVYSIAIGQGGTTGTANEVDLALMQSLAKPASGYFNVTSASDLPALFGDIFTSIACRPGIQIKKTADPTELSVGGGDVTYSYAVTNVGNVALSDVAVTDDKCSPVTKTGGDTNHDNKLDLDETWTFTCSATLTATTTNVGTATGWHGDTKVEDKDDATVTVAKATPTPTPTATATPTDEPTPTPTPTHKPTTKPSGGVGGETGTPAVTPPSTSTIGDTNGTSGSSPLLLALVLAAVASLILIATPRPARRTVRNDKD
ncbi:MAG TPA: vWA domain-containing protein [Candidatus Limnocylindrales bacterium]